MQYFYLDRFKNVCLSFEHFHDFFSGKESSQNDDSRFPKGKPLGRDKVQKKSWELSLRMQKLEGKSKKTKTNKRMGSGKDSRFHLRGPRSHTKKQKMRLRH